MLPSVFILQVGGDTLEPRHERDRDRCLFETRQGSAVGTPGTNVMEARETLRWSERTVYSGSSYVATGILLIDNAATSVTDTTADSDDVGIYALNDSAASASLAISGNTASNATNENGDGGIGIAIDSATSGTVESNTTDKDDGAGVAAYGVTGTQIGANTASGDYDGIYVGGAGTNGDGSSGNTISANTTSNNSDDGILADSDATGNTFEYNVSDSNVDYDYQDLSTGSGTEGTGNTWTDNKCQPAADSSPEGLC